MYTVTCQYDQSQDLFDCVVRMSQPKKDDTVGSTIVASVIVRYHNNNHAQINVLMHREIIGLNTFDFLGQIHAQVLEAIDQTINQ